MYARRLLTLGTGPDGKPRSVIELPFKGMNEANEPVEGGMVRAFYDRSDSEYKKTMAKGTAEEKAAMTAERDGERLAVVAWAKADAAARKKAYADDKFALPPDLDARPLTEAYKDGGAVKIKSLLTDRCARCHTAGGDKEDAPLDTYEDFLKYLPVGAK